MSDGKMRRGLITRKILNAGNLLFHLLGEECAEGSVWKGKNMRLGSLER